MEKEVWLWTSDVAVVRAHWHWLFRTVIGIDNSETQLKEAMAASAEFGNVFYKLGAAESVSSLLTSETVDLIAVGSALHWFEIATFY